MTPHNPGNFGMQFIPQWDTDVPINDVRVQIVLPPGVTASDVKTTQNFYNGTSTVDGKLAVYWEIPSHTSQTSSSRSAFLFQPSFMPNYIPSFSCRRIQTLAALASVIGVVGVLFAIVIFVLIISEHSAKAPILRQKSAWKRLG